MSIQPPSPFSPHSTAVIPNWHALTTPPPPSKFLDSDIPLLLFLPKRSLCPLVSDSQRCVMIEKKKKVQTPLSIPSYPSPAYLCICRRRNISAVAAAKHSTTKEMHTSDSRHQEGRWQNKGERWWSERKGCAERSEKEKERAFILLTFFSYFFFFFPGFIKPHLTYVWLGWR